MLNFPDISYQKRKEERQKYNYIEEENRKFYHCRMLGELEKNIKIPIAKRLPLDIFPISQKHSSVSNLPYGLIGTVAEAGCGVLAVEYALRLIGIRVDFRDILNECTEKGYRAYIYDEDDQIIDGAGTKTALFYNLAIECKNLFEIIFFLKSGVPMTLLLENSVYRNDPYAKGCHFITLIGSDENQNAIIMDGNKISDEKDPHHAICLIDFRKMIGGLEGAWAWDKDKVLGYLK